MSKRSRQLKPEAAAESTTAGANASRRGLAACLVLYVLLTGLLIASVPTGNAPDESAHVDYVRYLVDQGRLPVFQPLGATHPGYEFHQPPLYYVICAPFCKFASADAQFAICRLVSLLCAALTLVLLWHSVATLYPGDNRLPLLATGFAALWPMHQGVGASAGNDALAGLIAAAVFTMIARSAGQSWRTRELIVVGVLCGLGLLTKTTCLMLLFLAMGAAWQFSQRAEAPENSAMSPVFAAAIVLGVSLLVGGWWLLRNESLYGDPFALGVFNRAFGNDASAQLVQAVSLGGLPVTVYLRGLLFLLFCTAWGIFGGPETARSMVNPFTLRVHHPDVVPALVPMAVCLIASFVACHGLVTYVRGWRALPAATRSALGWWIGGWALTFAAFIAFNTHYFQAQARYFHPALLPMVLGFALGWRQAWSREAGDHLLWAASVIGGATLVGLTLWNVVGWRTLI